MKVFFDASVSTNDKVFLTIKSLLKTMSAELTYDWVERGSVWEDEKLSLDDRQIVFSKTIESILRADIVICDVSVSSMRIGHELAFALEKSKPTLAIADIKDRNVETLFLKGSRSGFLTLKNYDSYDMLSKIVGKFIKKNEGGGRSRLNLSLESYFNKYLEWKQFETGISKTEILKNAIKDCIQKDKWNDNI